MESYFNGVVGVLKIQNKADAMQYAINTTLKWKCGENSKVDYDEAKKLFDFICENVEFPADVNKLLVDELHQMVQVLSETQKSKSFLDRIFKSCDVPNAAAMCDDADMSTLEDAIFKPRTKEGE